MTYIASLTVIIQDRINHLETILKHYDDGEQDLVAKEIAALEETLDIITALE